MEWTEPGIVLGIAPYGEGDALACVFTETQGTVRGLARGGASRSKAATWQPGNLVEARWVARLSDQLGSFTGELIHPAAALAMQDRLALAILSSACATAAGALPQREVQPRIFRLLLDLIGHLAEGEAALGRLVTWECVLLSDLGYGLDLSACAVSGAAENLAYVSPRTGRAVSEAAAGAWRDRLLRLPRFLLDPQAPATPADWRDGLVLTGHFLARDAFGTQHRDLPAARVQLLDLLAAASAPPAATSPARLAEF
jgi:DNA repair protein RecO (recombination protein O)